MAARDALRNELVSPPGRSAPCAGFGDIRGDRGEQRRCVETSDEIGYGVDLPGVAPEFLKDESNGLKVWAEVADACGICRRKLHRLGDEQWLRDDGVSIQKPLIRDALARGTGIEDNESRIRLQKHVSRRHLREEMVPPPKRVRIAHRRGRRHLGI